MYVYSSKNAFMVYYCSCLFYSCLFTRIILVQIHTGIELEYSLIFKFIHVPGISGKQGSYFCIIKIMHIHTYIFHISITQSEIV